MNPSDLRLREGAGPWERALDALIVVAALATVPLTIALERGANNFGIVALDWSVWGIFVVEFLAQAMLFPARRKRHLVSLVIVALSFPLLPSLLGLVRLARLARAFRLLRLIGASTRGFADLRAVFCRRGLVGAGMLSLFLIFAGGGGLALLEPETVRGGILDGFWWAIVTASTVGYGDIAPSTPMGRVIAVVMMLAGIGLVSTLAASIAAHFVGQTENAELTELKRQADRIEALVRALVEQQTGLQPPQRAEVSKDGMPTSRMAYRHAEPTADRERGTE